MLLTTKSEYRYNNSMKLIDEFFLFSVANLRLIFTNVTSYFGELVYDGGFKLLNLCNLEQIP